MKIAIAQFEPKDGDVNYNLSKHYHLINLAAKNNADVIFFPEMSITGYTREKANDWAMNSKDTKLTALKELATLNNITIVSGAPIKIDSSIYIGSFIISPNGQISIYTKQNLHGTEKDHYSASSNYNPALEIENEKISLAICADISHPLHAYNASKSKASIYAAGIYFSLDGVKTAHFQMREYAKIFSMCTLFSNYCGNHWILEAGGKSAFWSENGELIGMLPSDEEGLLLIEKSKDSWHSQVINV